MKTNAFVKQLASNKRTVRDNALNTLKKFLGSKDKIGKLDINEFNKLWKGLFYTMWFSDRPRPQQRLANQLADLFSNDIIDEQFCKFVESYWTIMIKEWRELDKWRLDKFLMLMRYVVRECLVRLQKNDWDSDLIEAYFSVMKNIVLKDDNSVPRAIVYHIIDVWVDELERVIFISEEGEEAEEEDDESEETLTEEEKETKRSDKIAKRKEILEANGVPIVQLLAPFVSMDAHGYTEPLRKKIREEIIYDDRILDLDLDLENESEEEHEDVEEESDEEESTEPTVFKL